MTTPSIRDLQNRVNEIVAESKSSAGAIRTAQADPKVRGQLNEILTDAVIRSWTAKQRAEIDEFMAAERR